MKIRCLFVALIIAVSFFAGCSKERKPDIVSLTPEEEEFQKKALEKTRYSIKNEPPAVYKNTLPPMAEVNASYPAALTMHLPGPKGQENTHEQFLYIYKDKGWKGNHFIPSGWMGDVRDLVFSDDHTIDCYSGSCIKISYSNMASGGARWAGIYWQNPADNFGWIPEAGFDLSGKKRLTFWAKGENGGECIKEFKMGGISGAYPDSSSASFGPVYLTKEWRQYSINLAGKNLKYIIGGFAWATNLDGNPKGCTFYLDEIRYE